jgi:peptide/nickel transport system permease protein
MSRAVRGAAAALVGLAGIVLVLLAAASISGLDTRVAISSLAHGRQPLYFTDREPLAATIGEYGLLTLELLAVSLLVTALVALALRALSFPRVRPFVVWALVVAGCVPFFMLPQIFQFVGVLTGLPSAGRAGAEHFEIGDRVSHWLLPVGAIVMSQLPGFFAHLDGNVRPGSSESVPRAQIAAWLVAHAAAAFPYAFTMALLVEWVFAFSGLGRLLWGMARLDRDSVPLITAIVFFGALVALVLRLLAGLLTSEQTQTPQPTPLSKRAVVTLCVVAGVLAAFCCLPVPDWLTDLGTNIDQGNWTGNPAAPCFVNAKLCGGHFLGTDENGRDLLLRAILGARSSLGASVVTVLISGIAGLLAGLAARHGGAVVRFLVRETGAAISAFAAFPFVVMMALYAHAARDARLGYSAVIVLTALFFVPRVARLVAAAASVTSGGQIALRAAAEKFVPALFLLAAFDWFGVGLPAPAPSWGNMLEHWEENLAIAPWASLVPLLCLIGSALIVELTRRYLLERGRPFTWRGSP